MSHTRTGKVFLSLAVATAVVVTPIAVAAPAQAKAAPTQLNVLSFSGALDTVLEATGKGFEKKYNVQLNWEQGDPAGNVTKVLAGKGHQTYDIAFVDWQSQYTASTEGAWEKLNPKIVTNLKNIGAQGLTPDKDGLGYGTYPSGLYYNADIFKQNGWTAPTKFQDILNSKYCNKVGMMYVDDVNGLLGMLALGSNAKNTPSTDLNGLFNTGLKRLTAVKKCFPNFETSNGGLGQDILTNQYYTGIFGQNRVLPMQDSGAHINFVVPKGGAYFETSTVNIPSGAPHAKLDQEFVNYMASPAAQKLEMQNSYYSPTNKTVKIPAALAKRGVYPAATITKLAKPFDLKVVTRELPTWEAKWNAVFSN